MCACMFVWMYWYVQLSIAHTFEDITLLIEYIPVSPHFNLHTFTHSTSHTTTLPYNTHHTQPPHTLTPTSNTPHPTPSHSHTTHITPNLHTPLHPHPILHIPHLHIPHPHLHTPHHHPHTLTLVLHVPQWHSGVHSNQERVRGSGRG